MVHTGSGMRPAAYSVHGVRVPSIVAWCTCVAVRSASDIDGQERLAAVWQARCGQQPATECLGPTSAHPRALCVEVPGYSMRNSSDSGDPPGSPSRRRDCHFTAPLLP